MDMRGQRVNILVGLLVAVLTVFATGCGAGGAGSQFPTRELTYLIAFDPGGPSDREARRQQPLLEKYLGQKVVIDYKVGAGGALAWAEVSRAKPDGYLFVGINVPHIILQPLLQPEVGYKTEDLKVIALFQRTPIGLVVKKDSPYETLDDLLEAARQNPGSISISGSGTYTAYHFATIQLEKLTGAKFKYVPFNGNAPAMTAFLGGHTTATMAASDDMVKYKDQIRVLAIADEQRFHMMPEVPTFKELGYDLVEVVDRGVAVPKDTPDPVVKKLEEAFLKVANDPTVQEAMKKEGLVPIAMGVNESEQYIKKLQQRYTALVDEMR